MSDGDRQWQRLDVGTEGGVGVITLNRPEARNAIDLTTVRELEAASGELAASARVILVRAAGDHFCAGADLKFFAAVREDPEALREFVGSFTHLFNTFERARVPVVTAVQGFALAGGFELMQASDIVLVAEDAVIGDQHANFGLVPGGGGSQRLPRMVGRQRALALLMSGDRLTGAEAVEWGLAYRAYPKERLQDEAMEFCRKLAAKSSTGLARMKTLVDRGFEMAPEAGIEYELEVFLAHAQHPDFAEGLDAFANRRPPAFS